MTIAHRPLRRVAVIAGIVLAACAAPPPQPALEHAAQPAAFPARHYEEAARRGQAVFAVVGERSAVVVEVRRAGTLSRLGHDHVVVAHRVRGYVAPDEGRADLYLRLDELVVDEEDARRAAGFDTHPTPEQIEGTRRNMLTREIDAAQHPFVQVHVTRAGASSPAVDVELNGVTRAVPIALQSSVMGDELRAQGRFSIDQSAFGITPLSIAGGAIQVADRIDLRFDIVARRDVS